MNHKPMMVLTFFLSMLLSFSCQKSMEEHAIISHVIKDSQITARVPVVDSNINQIPLPVTKNPDIVSLDIVFENELDNETANFPLLKYDKQKCVTLNFDDANDASLKTLDKFQALKYSDGCGNYIPYSAGIAVNGRNTWNNDELGADAAYGVTYNQRKELIKKGWDVENHGFYHNDAIDNNSNNYSNGKDAKKNLTDLDAMILEKMQYKMNVLVTPTNYSGYMISGKQIGYIGGTSANTFDGLDGTDDIWDGWNKPKRVSKYSGKEFTGVQREFAQYQWVEGKDDPWVYLKEAINYNAACLAAFGTHGMNASEESYFRKWMDKIYSLGDDVMMTSLRELLEYQYLRTHIKKSETRFGKALHVELDYSNISNKNISWKDLSLVIGGANHIQSVTCDDGSFKLTFNKITNLVNIKKRITVW